MVSASQLGQGRQSSLMQAMQFGARLPENGRQDFAELVRDRDLGVLSTRILDDPNKSRAFENRDERRLATERRLDFVNCLDPGLVGRRQFSFRSRNRKGFECRDKARRFVRGEARGLSKGGIVVTYVSINEQKSGFLEQIDERGSNAEAWLNWE